MGGTQNDLFHLRPWHLATASDFLHFSYLSKFPVSFTTITHHSKASLFGTQKKGAEFRIIPP